MTKTNQTKDTLSGALIFLLALTTGLCVSTIYLIQPILNTLSVALHVPAKSMGLVMTLTQVGYGLGVLLLIPLGDVLPKKPLIVGKLALLAGALLATGFAAGFFTLLAGSLAIGLFASAAQDLVPLTADLAGEKRRGEAVGKVMSGLLLGILLSRTASGFISDAWGWRTVFIATAVAVLIVGILFALSIASQPPKIALPYRVLIQTTLRNFVVVPALRDSIITQGLLGFAFSAFWTNLSFFLAASPFYLSNSKIGLLGLAGAAGAVAAPLVGKISDRRGPQSGIMFGAGLVATSFAVMLIFPFSLKVLIAGTVFFDLGIQAALISHQSLIYSLDATSRSRFNALFVAGMFLSFSLGSLVSARLYARFQWQGVLCLATMSSFMAVAKIVSLHRRRNPTKEHA